MQLLTFPTPAQESDVQEHVIAMLEAALEMAKAGDISAAVVITLDDRDADDEVGVLLATDGWVQAAGMMLAAQRSL